MKLLQGIKLSYALQEILQRVQRKQSCVRGSRCKDGELPTALNGFLYSILKNTKAQRRGILTSLLKQFEEPAVCLLSTKYILLAEIKDCCQLRHSLIH